MLQISRYICLGILLVFSGLDIKNKEIPVCILVISSIAVCLYHLVSRNMDICILAGGVGTGIIFLAVSRITGEGLGYGDSLGILILGGYLGLWKIMELLSATFVLLALFSAAALSVRRMSRKYAFPFFPFLAAGYIVVMLAESDIL